MNHLAEREREKKEEGKKKKKKKKKKRKKKELSTESNLGPLILGISADTLTIIAKAYRADTLKGPGENTVSISCLFCFLVLIFCFYSI